MTGPDPAIVGGREAIAFVARLTNLQTVSDRKSSSVVAALRWRRTDPDGFRVLCGELGIPIGPAGIHRHKTRNEQREQIRAARAKSRRSEVARLQAANLTTKQIAAALRVSQSTVLEDMAQLRRARES